MGALALAFLAGTLSTLSPCVLPLIPIVLGAAVTQGRFGPLALAAGLALSFTAVGLFVATIGFAMGLDHELFRQVAAGLLMVIGAVLMMPSMQTRLAVAAGPLTNWAQGQLGGSSGVGPGGQFSVGLLLGAMWAPCVGPTLGAASVLAARGEDLGMVALTMLAFGLGAAVPLLLLGLLSRDVLMRWRDRLLAAGSGAKVVLGALLISAGILVLTGWDKQLETLLVDWSPDWLTALTVRF